MKRWIGLALAGASLCVAPWLLRQSSSTITVAPPVAEEDDVVAKTKAAEQGFEKSVVPPALAEVDLNRLRVENDAATAPAHGERVAHLTIQPTLQHTAERLLQAAGATQAAIVMTDVSGRILVWAGERQGKEQPSVCVDASAPAASIFKLVTASALVEQAGLSADTRQCYWGGDHRIEPAHLVDNKRKDRWCATLGEAMGRSLNTVFARLALKHLDANKLTTTAHHLGFGEHVPFDVPAAVNTLEIPDDTLGFARTSAGFWNTTLSPLGGVTLALTFANRGLMVRPYVIERITENGALLFRSPNRQTLRRAVQTDTAEAVTRMLENTVTDGTCHRSFHDNAGRAFLPNISIAGKTGTLTKASTDQLYTWFVGFAPSRAPEVAISVLVVNSSTWRVKANVVARDMLRAYFASKHAPGVTYPKD